MYTYNAQKLPVNVYVKSWNSATSSWEDYYQILYTYNTNNNPTQILMKVFIGTWVDGIKVTYTYNAQNKVTQTVTMRMNQSTLQLENDSRSTYTYDTNGYVIRELIESWENNSWVNSERINFTNNSSGYITQEITEFWSENNVWENDWKVTYIYDAKWKKIFAREYIWNETVWDNYWYITYTYDSQDRISETLFKSWESNAWKNFEIENWTYGLPIGVSDFTESPVTVKLYPNPAAGNATLSFELKDATDVNIRITDASGRIVAELKEPNLPAGIHNLAIPTSGLAPGYYMLSLGNNSGIIAKEKMLINK